MAAFFKTPAPPGVVVRAEHLFDRRCLAVQATPTTLVCVWTRDADGKLVGCWRPADPPLLSDEPVRLAAAG